MPGPLLTDGRLTLTLQSHIEDCWEEPAVADPEAPSELEAFQGTWLSVAGRREAELLISGNHFAVRFADGDIYIGVFELNSIDIPRAMAMHIHEGPTRHKDKTALCIYEFDGHHLHWCAAMPGQSERLAAFPEEDAGQHLYLVFRRQRPA
jgi:uncharacterized protein (TIGR03067 family)